MQKHKHNCNNYLFSILFPKSSYLYSCSTSIFYFLKIYNTILIHMGEKIISNFCPKFNSNSKQ